MDFMNKLFPNVKSIVSGTGLTTTAQTVSVKGHGVTVVCTSGNLWINPNGTAIADTTAIKLVPTMHFDLTVHSNLSLISDVTGATYSVVIWE